MTDVARTLNAIGQGDATATDEHQMLVYEEQRLLAARKLFHDSICVEASFLEEETQR